MKRSYLFGLVAILAGCFSGCVHLSGAAGASADSSTVSLKSFMPLAVGNRWIYQTTFQGQPQPDLAVTIVKQHNGFFIDDRPHPGRMKIDGEGIRDGNVRYLLKTPLRKGNKWMSVADVRTVEHYEIVGVNQEVHVPAGAFKGCVVVRMEVRMTDKRSMINKMFFAPQVGIVEIEASLKDGARTIPQSKLMLRSFVPARAGGY